MRPQAEVTKENRVTLFRPVAAGKVDGDEPPISARHEAGRTKKSP